MKKADKIGDFFKQRLEYCVALASFALFLLISVSDSGKKIEYGMYDTFLAIKPEIEQRGDILLVNIDDLAIEEIGAFPWTRDIIGDALIRLREVGGASVVFDIEYLSPGQTGVNREYVKNAFPVEFSGVRNEILDYLQSFADSVASKNIPLSYVPETGREMSAYLGERMSAFSQSLTANIFRDNDEYFAKGIRFFGNAFLTINAEMINTGESTRELNRFARDNRLFSNVSDPAGLIARENDWTLRDSDFGRGLAPAILPLLRESAGAGFPNVVIDEDGVRRRIELFEEYDGAYIGQLVFTPILRVLEPESIVRKGHRLILKNALDPSNPASGVRNDLPIPLDDDGRLLINWLKRHFIDPQDPARNSFRQISIYSLKSADEMEEKLIDNLASVRELVVRNAEGYLSYHDAADWLLASYQDLSVRKQGLLDAGRDDFAEYFAARKEFFADYGEFLDGGFDAEIAQTLDAYGAMTGKTEYAELKAQILKNFDVYRSEYEIYQDQFADLVSKCAGSFCIIGWSGVGTSDLGVNPFAKSYPNVGTHANIYNTIMTKQFITPLPVWVSWLVALVLCYLVALANRRIKSLKVRLAFGIGSSMLVFVVFAFVFAAFRVYIQLFVPLLSVALTFLLVSILRFMFSEQEKSFLRKAFTTYLSPDVVDQIVENPGLLKLGGQERQITALFTDIKSFSTLSEKVTPEHLVQILNKYLTVMSDIVLDQKGTIDKYIGDAIVSFFGAPLDLPDHAKRACLSAVRMKEAEDRLNGEFRLAGDVPMEIHTRIGVNSGPMVVGNMGTENKMNYTIMGNDVNLAARLEGVNKQYGTWILVSESTWNATDGLFLGRKLDRVRVVGISAPVQLYNLMAVRSEASPEMAALVERFDQAIDAYRERKLPESLALFTKCAEIDPDDAASKIFLERVRDLIKTGVPPDWSDVINMTTK